MIEYYSPIEIMLEALEDAEELQKLRVTKEEEGDLPTTSLEEAKRKLGI